MQKRGDYMLVMDIPDIVLTYVSIIGFAVPISLVFGLSNIAVNMILTAAFGGGIRIGGRK